ncbi:MAG: hypothetical protein FJW95_00570 [Actinobacteria bacterium]|nr:hypothetical protein [Actinomycetota bacterium]
MGPFRLLHRFGGFPETIVIDSHLYDFFPTSPVLALRRTDYRRAALLRNQRKALELLDELLGFLQGQGYRFTTVGEVLDRCESQRDDLPRVGLDHLERTAYKPPPRDKGTVAASEA